jgi:hypothetical protein
MVRSIMKLMSFLGFGSTGEFMTKASSESGKSIA